MGNDQVRQIYPPNQNMADVNVDEFQRLWGFQAHPIHEPIPRAPSDRACPNGAHQISSCIRCIFTTPCLNPQIALKRQAVPFPHARPDV